MAQSKKPQYSLAQYRAEAKKEPFELDLGDGKVITIPPPTGTTLLDLDSAFTTRAVMEHLAGDQYDALLEILGDEDGGVLVAVVKAMQKHFGLGG
jgi:hypothetical protein